MFNLSAHKNSFALYFICTLGWSWLFWVPAVFLGYEQSDPIGMTLSSWAALVRRLPRSSCSLRPMTVKRVLPSGQA
jgi:hypothetical protein